jgi:hypothetical protein
MPITLSRIRGGPLLADAVTFPPAMNGSQENARSAYTYSAYAHTESHIIDAQPPQRQHHSSPDTANDEFWPILDYLKRLLAQHAARREPR